MAANTLDSCTWTRRIARRDHSRSGGLGRTTMTLAAAVAALERSGNDTSILAPSTAARGLWHRLDRVVAAATSQTPRR